MKILVTGSGGREHALAWRLAQSPRVSRVYVAPGNAGTAEEDGLFNVEAVEIPSLVQFAKDQWKAADKAISQMTDTHLTNTVSTPWNFEAPGSVMLEIIQDEYLHHRGQLYAYVRALGNDVPMMWDFENNAPEYQPKQATQA